MARFRRRYTAIDHENGQMREVGLHFFLNPAKNLADYAAMVTLAENVEPEMAADLRAHLAMIDAHPDRHVNMGSFGVECLPYITHPAIAHVAKAEIERRAKR